MTREQYIEARKREVETRYWRHGEEPISVLAEAVDLLREALMVLPEPKHEHDDGRHGDPARWCKRCLMDRALALTAPKEDRDGA